MTSKIFYGIIFVALFVYRQGNPFSNAELTGLSMVFGAYFLFYNFSRAKEYEKLVAQVQALERKIRTDENT